MTPSLPLRTWVRHGIAVMTAFVEAFAIFLIAFAVGQYMTGSEKAFVRLVTILLMLVSVLYFVIGYHQRRTGTLLSLNLMYCSCFLCVLVVILYVISQPGLF